MKNLIIVFVLISTSLISCVGSKKALRDIKAIHSQSNSLSDDHLVRGIDISKWQGNLVDDLNPSHNLSFVICKVSEGSNFVDKRFSYNWNKLNELGLIRGGYHFYITSKSPHAQFRNFSENIDLKHTDLPPILDIEQGSIKAPISPFKLQKDLLKYLKLVERKAKRLPIVYTSRNFANEYLNDKSFSKYPLWIADYSAKNEPRLPLAWSSEDWSIWQMTDSFEIASKKVDYDIFNGSFVDLKKFIEKSSLRRPSSMVY